MMYSLLFHAICCYLFVCIFLIATQHLQIFPGFLRTQLRKITGSKTRLPSELTSTMITTEDNQSLDVWHLPATTDVQPSDYIAVIFHGNAGSLEDFILLQLWCQERGLKSYSFDYRGFGKSSGFPTEQGVYKDSEAFINHVLEEEDCESSSLVLIGFSLGGAIAARVAAKHDVHTLVLISTFTSIDEILRRTPLFSFLRFANMTTLPTENYVRQLTSCNLILVHSKRDKTVPYAHLQKLSNTYCGTGTLQVLTELEAGHNGTFYMQRYNLASAFRAVAILPALED